MQDQIRGSEKPYFTYSPDKAEPILFFVLAITGFIGALLTYPLLDGYAYNFGPKLIGAFIAPFLCSIYLAIIAAHRSLAPKYLLRVFLLYGIQSMPFALLFFQVFEPTPMEDFERYCTYAKNMIDQGTLWGGDSLVFPKTGKHYMTQPGYRYLIALEWIAFGKLYRFVSFLNICISLLGLFYLQKTIQQVVVNRRIELALSALVVCFTPYLIKNSLMGLPEWISMFLLMMATYLFLIRKKELAPVLLLALIPFFRQNILVTMVLLAGMIIAVSKKEVQLIAGFMVVVLLPVYHNLYYAREWRFLVDIFEYPFLTYDATEKPTAYNPLFILRNVLHYTGYDFYRGGYHFSLIAFFIIYAVFIYFYLLRMLPGRNKLIYLLITGSAIGPALLLGGGYYPRFEFVNTVIMVVSFLFLSALPVFKGKLLSVK